MQSFCFFFFPIFSILWAFNILTRSIILFYFWLYIPSSHNSIHISLLQSPCLQGGGADTLKFSLYIIGRAKKGCEFNQKRCEFKNSPKNIEIKYLLLLLSCTIWGGGWGGVGWWERISTCQAGKNRSTTSTKDFPKKIP
jgi:hypothetical protein